MMRFEKCGVSEVMPCRQKILLRAQMIVHDRDLPRAGNEIPEKSPEDGERGAILGMDFV
jgi:hypothetical protein